MTKEELLKLKDEISKLSDEDLKKRYSYLRGLANGELQGPLVGYPTIDKPWRKYYDKNISNIAKAITPNANIGLINKKGINRYRNAIITIIIQSTISTATQDPPSLIINSSFNKFTNQLS